MSSSQLRIESSRANGALSQGPSTPQGKLRASRNAEKHGMYSGNIVLACESELLYQQKRDEYYRRFQPVDTTETDLVDQLVACQWRLQRIVALETAAINHAVEMQAALIDETYESIDVATRTMLAVKDVEATLTAYRRFEATLARQFHRALEQLRKLQDERGNAADGSVVTAPAAAAPAPGEKQEEEDHGGEPVSGTPPAAQTKTRERTQILPPVAPPGHRETPGS
jgi:hypothetical protein